MSRGELNRAGAERGVQRDGGSGPQSLPPWHHVVMSGTHVVTVGNRGRIVVPAEVREREGWVDGTPLVLLATPSGVVLMTRGQLRERVRDELAGLDLVADLLADRRLAAAAEDVA